MDDPNKHFSKDNKTCKQIHTGNVQYPSRQGNANHFFSTFICLCVWDLCVCVMRSLFECMRFMYVCMRCVWERCVYVYEIYVCMIYLCVYEIYVCVWGVCVWDMYMCIRSMCIYEISLSLCPEFKFRSSCLCGKCFSSRAISKLPKYKLKH